METLDKHFRALTRAAFARYGFAQAELMARWPEIVGETLARHCRPERIRWPKTAEAMAQKQGGTLVIRAAAGRALDVQHETAHIIERINRYYGYGAIAAVKITQDAKPVTTAPPRPEPVLAAADEAALEARLQAIADPTLKAALKRLGSATLKRARSSPQGQ
jgi:hypothetical protein